MRLAYLSTAWVLGIYLGTRFEVPWAVIIPLAGLLAIGSLLSFRMPVKNHLPWIGLCLVLLLGGIIRSQSVPQGDELQGYRGLYEIEGTVAAAPVIKDRTTLLEIEAKKIRSAGEEWETVSGKLHLYAPKYLSLGSRDFPYYHYGDSIRFSGEITSPRSFENQSDFDFAAYLARQGIYSVIYTPEDINLVGSGYKSDFLEGIHHLRRSMTSSLEKALPDPQCALAKAMLLGDRSSITPEVKTDFSRSGTAHLLAISGIHVSIMAGIALGAGAWIFGRHRPTYILFALGLIWLYAILSGLGPSAFRASLMASLWLWAVWLGRQKSALAALTLAAAIMLAITPRLLSDVGFQLSFAAMAGLIFLTPLIQAQSQQLIVQGNREISTALNFTITSFSVTLGAVLATMPLVAYYFHYISYMSLPATFISLPAVPGIIITASLAAIAGIFAPAVATVIGWVSWAFTTYVLEVARFFAGIPFASNEVKVTAPMIYAYYGLLIASIWTCTNFNRVSRLAAKIKPGLLTVSRFAARISPRWATVPLLVVAVLVWTAAVTAQDSRLHVYVLDIGQGDAILLAKDNQQILIDGGPNGKSLMSELGERLPYWDRTIEMVVITHPDADHITGLIDVLRRYQVEKVLISDQDAESSVYAELCRIVEEKEIPSVTAQTGQKIAMSDGVYLNVLHPCNDPGTWDTADSNDNSIVLRLEYGNFSMLLTGDISTTAEAFLLDRDCPLKSTLLKVAHHGAATSSSPDFVKAVDPCFAAISAGRDNDFGHPHPGVLETLEKVAGSESIYTTAQDGTIEFTTNGSRLWISTSK